MIDILNTILPVFIIMLAGYGAVKSGYLDGRISDHLNTITIRFAVPVLLFRAIYNLDIGRAIQPSLLLGFYTGAFVSFALAVWLAAFMFKRRPGEAVAVGFCAMFSNSVLLGVPIVERAFGAQNLPLAFGIIAFHAPGLYIVGIFAMEFARRDGRSPGQTIKSAARSIFANPLMIGILSGAVFNLLSVPLPVAVSASVDMIAQAAIPIALIGIGSALTRYEIKSKLSETLMVSLMSLVVHPAIVLLITHFLFDLPKEWVQVAVIIAAMPPGMNIYIFATMYKRAVALSASAIVIATMASVLTISVWLWILAGL